MRVGFDARWYNDSGVGVYVAGLLRALTERRQDFDLVVYEDPRNPVLGLAAHTVERIQIAAQKYSVSEQWELKGRCKKDGLDVFHSPFYVMPLLAPCPVVVTVHDVIPLLFHINPWPKQALVKLGYRLAVSHAAQTIAVSENTAADIRRILKVNPDRITVVPNAADGTCFHARPQPAEIEHLATKYGLRPPYVVLASARNWRTKNLPGALKAVEMACEKSRLDFQTVVFGPDEGLRRAEAEISRSLPNLLTTGYIAPEELGILFRHAHAFVMPSLYEGFGLPVLEAMS
ncbi:MAG TPA: glycosyltransferase family 1 protein, partial [Candidatus Angelobacter sp.]|nr:glycosyltransferase family 1 protein [Candidatus Angelobacter sp.]